MKLSIFHKFMVWLGRYRLIKDRQGRDPYLARYYLFLRNRNEFFFNIFLHKFLKSDPDDLHDHPWDYISIPLWPGYWEHTPEGCFWRGPLSFRYREAKSLHRIELPSQGYCWSFFIPFVRKREWGFNTRECWIPNNEYLKEKDI